MLMNVFIGKYNVYYYRLPVNESISTLNLPVSGAKTSLSLELILIIFLDIK